jgi:hypothetical protein
LVGAVVLGWGGRYETMAVTFVIGSLAKRFSVCSLEYDCDIAGE